MLTVIIPTLNAEADIGRCLQAFSEREQIIVVDGGSTDKTRAIALNLGAEVITAAPGRGSQLRTGAAAATGEWLLFVHADTILEPGWRAAVEEHQRLHPDKAGYFRFRLMTAEWQARLLEYAVAARCRFWGLPYGDQGLLLPRSLYEDTGGFTPVPLMEDVDLVRRIGSRRLAPIEADAVTSARRWHDGGWGARSARNVACLFLYRLGVPPARLEKLYR